jgi:hypothetical protein
MLVTGVSLSFGQNRIGPQPGLQPRQSDLQGLEQSFKSGDLSGAKSAFAALQEELQKVQSNQQVNQTTNSGKLLSDDLQGLAQSLRSGDLAGAQRAFATLEQHLRNAGLSQLGQPQQAVGPSQAAATYSQNGNATASSGLLASGSNLKVSA